MIAAPIKISRKPPDISFLLFLAIYIIGMFYLCYSMNIWEDEGYSLETTSNGFWKVVTTSYRFEGQPPFYFLLLTFWRKIDSGIFFSRLLSIAVTGVGAYYFDRLIRLVLNGRYSKWMVVLFLLNPFTIWCALEIRLYALLLCLASMAIYYFLVYVHENKRSALLALLVVTVIGLYTQYFFAFLIVSLAVYLFCTKGWSAFFRFCLYQIPVILLFAPNLYFLASQVKMHSPLLDPTSPLDYAIDIILSLQSFYLGLQWAEFGRALRWLVKLLFVLAIAFTYFSIFKKKEIRQSVQFGNFNIWLICIGVNLGLYIVAVSATHIAVQNKYLAAGFPLYFIAIALFSWLRVGWRNIAYGLLSVLYLVTIFEYYSYPVKLYDFKTASNYVERIQQDKDPVIFYTKGLLPPFKQYYKGGHSLHSIPDMVYDENYYETDVEDTTHMTLTIQNAMKGERSFIILTGGIRGFLKPSAVNKDQMDFYLNNHYTVVNDTLIEGRGAERELRVRRFKLKD